ncbi:MAG: ZIP family metal transporter [Halobacteriota archaeon]
MTDSTADGTVSEVGRDETVQLFGLPRWVWALVPIVLIALVLVGLLVAGPGFERGAPQPELSISYHTIPDENSFVLHVTNDGSTDLTIAQVFVDGAYWNFEVDKTRSLPLVGSGDGPNTLAPGEQAEIVVPYHLDLNPDNAMEVRVVLGDGGTIPYEIEGVQTTGGFGVELVTTLAIIGLFVGVIPVAIGMLWYPYIRSLDARWLFAILAFAAGVLAFLAVESLFEAFELAARIPGAYLGDALIILATVGTLLLVQSVSEWRKERQPGAHHGLWVAYLVAIGIGLHNLAEGLAIGGAYALGQMSLAAFLVIGFMLHNVTEGPAIVAPLARRDAVDASRPALWHFLALGAIAGGPVILGGWIGGLSLSPTIGAFFLAVGAGAILQVIWELIGLVRADGGRAVTSYNLLAFLIGAIVMYLTGLFVAL